MISTVRKKTTKGGKWHCQVWRTTGLNVCDVTEEVAKDYNFTLEKGSITIHSGSGTGFGRIENALRKESSVRVVDVSVFNQ